MIWVTMNLFTEEPILEVRSIYYGYSTVELIRGWITIQILKYLNGCGWDPVDKSWNTIKLSTGAKVSFQEVNW